MNEEDCTHDEISKDWMGDPFDKFYTGSYVCDRCRKVFTSTYAAKRASEEARARIAAKKTDSTQANLSQQQSSEPANSVKETLMSALEVASVILNFGIRHAEARETLDQRKLGGAVVVSARRARDLIPPAKKLEPCNLLLTFDFAQWARLDAESRMREMYDRAMKVLGETLPTQTNFLPANDGSGTFQIYWPSIEATTAVCFCKELETACDDLGGVI